MAGLHLGWWKPKRVDRRHLPSSSDVCGGGLGLERKGKEAVYEGNVEAKEPLTRRHVWQVQFDA